MPRRRRRSRKGSSRRTCYYKVRGRYLTARQARKSRSKKRTRRRKR